MALNNGALGGRAYSSPSGRQVQQQHHHHHLHHNHGHLPHPPLYSSSSSSSSSAYPPVASTSSAVAGTQSDEFSEIKAVTLEWRLSDLKQIFDGSRGEAKSRCIKSAPFGDGKWEVYFYANSGSDYVSLYLSAEPTPEEREAGLRLAASRATTTSGSTHSRSHSGIATSPTGQSSLAGGSSSANSGSNANPPPTSTSTATPWVREGSYRFIFEIRPYAPASHKPGASTSGSGSTGNNAPSTTASTASTSASASNSVFALPPIKTMEAADHVFSHEARNWGWQSFARRNDVYYSNAHAKTHDAFVVVCTITYSPTPPAPPRLGMGVGGRKKLVPTQLTDAFAALFDDPVYSDVKFLIRTRSVSTGKIHNRSLYAMRKILSSRAEYFATMFSSGFSEGRALPGSEPQHDSSSDWDDASELSSVGSDDDIGLWDTEDDEDESETEGLDKDEDLHSGAASEDEGNGEGAAEQDDMTGQTFVSMADEDASTSDEPSEQPASASPEASASPTVSARADEARLLLRPLPGLATTTTTMRSVSTALKPVPDSLARSTPTPGKQRLVARKNSRLESQEYGKRHIEIVVKDTAYTTYKALLYFLYTDTIAFAPLSSSYMHARDTAEARGQEFPYSSRRAYYQHHPSRSSPPQPSVPSADLVCSAKAIYKLADKLHIPELKARAFEHIVQSLTDLETIPYEAFSQFSRQFEEVRKVVGGLMLANWNEIRHGQALKNVFRLVRQDPDRFPAFEEVWEYIITNLEYKPPAANAGAWNASADCGNGKE